MATPSVKSKNFLTKDEELFQRQIAEDRAAFEHADPKENIERRREYSFHIGTSAAWKSFYSSPVHALLIRGAKVLDVGCGFASWCRAMAKMYPQSQFVACDTIHQFADDGAETPSNITFCPADFLEGLSYPADSFDFIFLRSFICGMPKSKWPEIMDEAMRLLKPGGWVEAMELNATPDPAGPASKTIAGYLDRAFQRVNLPLPIVENSQDLFNGVQGLSCIQREKKKVPAGKWAGWQGTAMLQNNCLAVDILEPFIKECLGVSTEEYRKMAAQNIREHEKYKACMISIRLYAQKTFY